MKMFANDSKKLEWLYTHCGCKMGMTLKNRDALNEKKGNEN